MLVKDYNGTLTQTANCLIFSRFYMKIAFYVFFYLVIHICISLAFFCICQKITVIQVCCFPLNSHSKSCCSVQISVLVDKTKNCKKRGKSQFMVYLKFQLEPCLTVFDRSLWKSYFNRTVSFKKVFNFIFLECF